MTSQTGKDRDDDSVPAREHSPYADEDNPESEARPREKGDYDDPVKRQTGRGNASKGPWKDQGGAGHGENYGAREDETPAGKDE